MYIETSAKAGFNIKVCSEIDISYVSSFKLGWIPLDLGAKLFSAVQRGVVFFGKGWM
jgi:hypothetical protein